MSYETRDDTEIENIEVDEPVIQRIVSVPRARIKHEASEDSTDPLYTGEYLDEEPTPAPAPAPKRKSPTKRQSTVQTLDGKISVFLKQQQN